MPVAYGIVERQVAIRINALAGATVILLSGTYNTTPLTQANYQSAVFPRQAVLDAILWAEEQIADTIASTGNHPYRSYLADFTPPIPNGGIIPPYSSTNKPIIGIFGSVYDAVDDLPCTEQPIETIKRYNRNTDIFICAAYYYKMDGWRCYHSRTVNNVRIDVCSYDRAAQAVLQAANGDILLPDTTEPLYEMGALAFLTRDDEFQAQSSQAAQGFSAGLAGIRQGLTSVAAKEIPFPMSSSVAT